MDRLMYQMWRKNLFRCSDPESRRKVCWPTRELAEAAIPHLVQDIRDKGEGVDTVATYFHNRCGKFHITTHDNGYLRRLKAKRERRVERIKEETGRNYLTQKRNQQRKRANKKRKEES